MDPISIVDVIDHRNKYSVQRMIVLNRFPEPAFVKDSKGLIGQDGPVFQFYRYERPGPTWKAFGGRKFEIPMKDGSIIEATGQWWDTFRSDFHDRLYSLGMATVEQLGKCNVFFSSMHIERALVDSWLAENEPSNNYDKYDSRHAEFGKHRIVSPWEPAVA